MDRCFDHGLSKRLNAKKEEKTSGRGELTKEDIAIDMSSGDTFPGINRAFLTLSTRPRLATVFRSRETQSRKESHIRNWETRMTSRKKEKENGSSPTCVFWWTIIFTILITRYWVSTRETNKHFWEIDVGRDSKPADALFFTGFWRSSFSFPFVSTI